MISERKKYREETESKQTWVVCVTLTLLRHLNIFVSQLQLCCCFFFTSLTWLKSGSDRLINNRCSLPDPHRNGVTLSERWWSIDSRLELSQMPRYFVQLYGRFNLSVQLKVISWVVYSHFALWKTANVCVLSRSWSREEENKPNAVNTTACRSYTGDVYQEALLRSLWECAQQCRFNLIW